MGFYCCDRTKKTLALELPGLWVRVRVVSPLRMCDHPFVFCEARSSMCAPWLRKSSALGNANPQEHLGERKAGSSSGFGCDYFYAIFIYTIEKKFNKR
jgi:hypothetical protein